MYCTFVLRNPLEESADTPSQNKDYKVVIWMAQRTMPLAIYVYMIVDWSWGGLSGLTLLTSHPVLPCTLCCQLHCMFVQLLRNPLQVSTDTLSQNKWSTNGTRRNAISYVCMIIDCSWGGLQLSGLTLLTSHLVLPCMYPVLSPQLMYRMFVVYF